MDDVATTNTKPSQVYSVNGLTFNKQFNTFATYGQDGAYYFWNKDTKSKLRNTKAAPYPVTAASFLDNGKLLIQMITI